MKGRIRNLLLLLTVLVAFTAFPSAVSAAKLRLYSIKNDVSYGRFDVNGDGKKDRFRVITKAASLEPGNAYFAVNGKKYDLFIARGAKFFLAVYDRKNTFLVKQMGLYGGEDIAIYRLNGTVFRSVLINDDLPDFDNTVIEGVKNGFLYFRSSTYRPRGSFAHTPQWVARWKMRLNTKKHTFELVNATGNVLGSTVFRYSGKTFRTSASRVNFRPSSFTLRTGDRVRLLLVRQSFKWFDQTGYVYYQIQKGSRKGWFRDTYNEFFHTSDNDPGRSFVRVDP